MSEAHHALLAFLGLPEIGDEPGIEIAIDTGLNFINMRGDITDQQFIAAASEVLGQDIPAIANTTTRAEHVVFWLGPDEWLIASEQAPRDLISRLGSATSGQFATFTDVSHGYTSLSLSGKAVRDVLSKGCTLDLHKKYFLPGDCAQTTLAKASMLLTLPQATERFDIVLRRSFAEYAALWLRHAAAEFGVRSVTI